METLNQFFVILDDRMYRRRLLYSPRHQISPKGLNPVSGQEMAARLLGYTERSFQRSKVRHYSKHQHYDERFVSCY